MLFPSQSYWQFLQCNHKGQHWEMPLHCPFLCTCIALQSGIMQHKKSWGLWWQTDHWTWFKRTNQAPWFQQFLCCPTPWYYQGKVPWPSKCPETSSFQKNTPIFTIIWYVHRSPKSHSPRR
jgi:hypothetical protein